MQLQIHISNGGYSDHVKFAVEDNLSIGQALYRMLSSQVGKIVISKRRGALKGVDLRKDWDVRIEANGNILMDSASIFAASETKFPIRMGTTDRGVERFRQQLCEMSVLCLMPFLIDKDASWENGYLLNRETLASEIRKVMKIQTTEMVKRISETNATETTAAAATA